MELVYLWVEEYKNIKNQGFNFSPRFTCQYDEASKELTIDEKEHVSIFPENINVTAIVGENGSGKSRLLELISLFRFEKLGRSNKHFFITYFYKNELFVILNTKKDYHCFDNFNLENINNTTQFKVNTSYIHQKIFSLCFFSNGLSNFADNDRLMTSNHYDCFYNGCDNTMKFEYKFAYLLQQKSDFFKLLNKDFIFNKMRLELNLKYINVNSNNDDTKEKIHKLQFFFKNNIDTSSFTLGEEKNDPSKEVYVYNFLASFFLNIYIDLIDDFSNELNKKFRNKFLDEFIAEIQSYLDEKKKNDHSIPYNILILHLLAKKFKELKELIFSFFKGQQGQLDHFQGKTKEIEKIEEFNDIAKYIFDYFELDKTLNILVSKSENIQEDNLKKYQDFFSKNAVFTYLNDYGILKINFFDNNAEINFLDLSTGEQQIITFIVNFTYTLIKTNENRIILLDEIEVSLHPQWQKELFFFIINYIDFMKYTKLIEENKYHLLITSHSPFVLSDLPKENIIFLEKGKQVEVDINTFGANIHTLLSNGFFMKDGLMGEFAKEKIQSVIDFLRDTGESNLNQQEAWSIIKIIGEPFLKHKLEEKFHEKFSTDEEKRTAKIKQLEEELERLKNVKSKD